MKAKIKAEIKAMTMEIVRIQDLEMQALLDIQENSNRRESGDE